MRRLGPLVFSAVSCFAQSTSFQWVQTVGGSASAAVAAVATDSQGNSYVVGNTTSVDMAVRGAAQSHPAGSGLYRIDGPASNWTSLYDSGATSVSALAVSVQHPQLAFAVSPQGLLRTADGGATWTVALPPVSPPFTPSVTSVAIDPTNDALVYAVGSPTFYTSTDSGLTWSYGVIFGAPNPDHRIWVDARQPQVLFSVSSGNLIRNSNRGTAAWQSIPTSTGPLSMAFDPFTTGTIYAATQKNLQVSTDDGLTWSSLGQPNTVYTPQYILADPLHQGTLYASSYGGVFRSVDSGATWTQVGSDTNAGPMAADAVSGAIYFWISGTVFKSSDGLATRTAIGPPSLQQAAALAVAGPSLYLGVAATTDIFVTKLDPAGNTIYSTYFGGTGSDVAQGIATDSLGAAYVTGTTASPDFPVTPAAFAKSGGSFLFKLNPDGSTAYSTYFSDSRSRPNAIAVDSQGHAYIAGTTYGGLPVTPGVYQTKLQGVASTGFNLGPGPPPPTNGFIAEFSPDGASLIYSTYFGNQNVIATALALESDGTAIVAGGSTLYHMYWGGLSLVGTANVAGAVYALAVDGADNIYAAGGSGPELFSGTQGAFQTAPVTLPIYSGGPGNGGLGDAFLAKFDSQLRLLSATLLGGEAPDQAQAVALAANGNVYLGGSTSSKAFPTRGATQSSFSASTSASTSFFAGLTPDLSALQFSTYVGDTRTFSILSLASMPDGGAVVAGSTLGPIFQSYFSGFDPAVPNASQALVARYTVTPQTVIRIDSVLNAASHLGVALSAGETFLVTGAGFGNDVALLLNGAPLPLISKSATTLVAAVPLDFASPAAATITVQSGGGSSSILAPFSSAAPGIFSIDGSGLGQGYVLNADGTLNSPANPALEGSKITVFATGVGPMTFTGPYAVTGSPVEVLVDGFLAPGIAAVLGPAAGLPGNVYRISVYVPQPSISAASNSYFTNFHLPAQSAVTLLMNPLQNGAQSQAGLGISVTH